MFLLDTNVVNAYRNGDQNIVMKWESVYDKAYVSGIVVEEILQIGHFAAINTIRSTGKGKLKRGYEDMFRAVQDLGKFNYLPYTDTAEILAKTLKIKGMDAKIAAHALELNFTLVTENTRDFDKVFGLRLVNWAD